MWWKSFSLAGDWRSTDTERCDQITATFRSDGAGRVTASQFAFFLLSTVCGRRGLLSLSQNLPGSGGLPLRFQPPALSIFPARRAGWLLEERYLNLTCPHEPNYRKSRRLHLLVHLDGVFLRDVSCYFSVLEDARPRDKLECGFLLLSAFNVVWQHLIYIPLLRPEDGPGEKDKSLLSLICL